jgi:hypothetical protein
VWYFLQNVVGPQRDEHTKRHIMSPVLDDLPICMTPTQVLHYYSPSEKKVRWRTLCGSTLRGSVCSRTCSSAILVTDISGEILPLKIVQTLDVVPFLTSVAWFSVSRSPLFLPVTQFFLPGEPTVRRSPCGHPVRHPPLSICCLVAAWVCPWQHHTFQWNFCYVSVSLFL